MPRGWPQRGRPGVCGDDVGWMGSRLDGRERCGWRRGQRQSRGEDQGRLFLRARFVEAPPLENVLPPERQEELQIRAVDSAGMSAPV